MAIAYRAEGTKVNGTTSVGPISQPAGTATGDVLVALIVDHGTAGPQTTAPTGWTAAGFAAGTAGRFQVFTAVVGSGGLTGTSWTWSSLTTRSEGIILGFTGVDNTTPADITASTVNASARNNASGTTGALSITSVTNGAMVIAAFCAYASGSTWTAEAVAGGPTLTSVTSQANSTFCSIGYGYGVKATAGATGVSSATMGTAGTNAGILIALRPVITTAYTLTADPGSISDTGTIAGTLFQPQVSAVSGSFAETGSAATFTKNGLLGWWTFDDGSGPTAVDSSGQGNDGTLVNGPTWVSGHINGALSFDGSTQYVSTSYVQTNVEAYSVAAWINIPSSQTDVAAIVQDRGTGSGLSLSLFLGGSGSGFVTTGYPAFCLDTGGSIIGIQGPAALNDGSWHHVVGTWAASSGTAVDPTQFSLYVDGILQTPASINLGSATSPLTGSGGSLIGYHQTFNTYLKGILDDVRIYDHALSSTEVTALYNWAGGGTSYSLSCDVGVFSETGVAVGTLFQQQVTASSGTFSETGTAASPLFQPSITAASGTFAETGTTASLLAALNLTAGIGSFTETGTAATLLPSKVLSVDPGAFTETGTAAGLNAALSLQATSGSYAESGTAASLPLAMGFTAGSGSYLEIGTAANLPLGHTLSASAGAFAETGTAASFPVALNLSAGIGSFVETGTAATLTTANLYTLVASAGAFTESGTAATLTSVLSLTAVSGAFAETGTAATLGKTYALSAASGTFAETGTAVSFQSGTVFGASAGSVTVTGTDATLSKTGALALATDAGSFVATGTVAALPLGHTLAADSGALAVAGIDATFSFPTRNFAADSGTFLLSEGTAALQITLAPPLRIKGRRGYDFQGWGTSGYGDNYGDEDDFTPTPFGEIVNPLAAAEPLDQSVKHFNSIFDQIARVYDPIFSGAAEEGEEEV